MFEWVVLLLSRKEKAVRIRLVYTFTRVWPRKKRVYREEDSAWEWEEESSEDLEENQGQPDVLCPVVWELYEEVV